MITHASTFSGIGAPEIAATMLGWQNLFHCEINDFGREVLNFHFPNSKSYEDITTTDFSEWGGKVTVLTGGFPCQPFSTAGKRKGARDDRYLWPYMLRCIKQVRPTWFIGENVAGITSMVLPGEEADVEGEANLFGESNAVREKRERYVLYEIISQLEEAGYSVQPFVVPACAVGAPHRRDRVFIVARLVEDTVCCGLVHGEHDIKRRVWNFGHVSTGNTERLCGDTMAGAAANANGCDDATRRPKETTGTIQQEGLQERDAVQQPIVTTSIRQGVGGPTSYTDGARCERCAAQRIQGCARRTNEVLLPFRSGSCDEMGGALRAPTFPDDGTTPNTEDLQRNGCIFGNREDDKPRSTELGNSYCKTTCRNNTPDTESQRSDGLRPQQQEIGGAQSCKFRGRSGEGCYLLPENRWRAFPSVSPVYRGNDGLPFSVDSLTIPFSKWRREALKAYGNAIVPQVMYEIFRCIDAIENNTYDAEAVR